MYAQDYDGKLCYYPYDNDETPSVMGKVFPYVKSAQLFRCPSANIKVPDDPTMRERISTTYGMPGAYDVDGYMAAIINLNFNGKKIVNMDSIPEPSITCMVGETVYGDPNNRQLGMDRFEATNLAVDSYNGLLVTDRHFDGSNYAFMDGHVKWLKKDVALTPHDQNKAIKFYWRS